MSFVSCEIDARHGGAYRFVFSHPCAEQPAAFFGRYLDVTPPSRIVWTNEEGGDAGQVTTVTFEDSRVRRDAGGHATDLYPSKEALDEAIASESTSGCSEQFEQLDELLEA